MKLPFSRTATLRTLVLVAAISVCAYQQWQIIHLKNGLQSVADLDTVNAITQRINGVDDRLDAVSQLKPVTADDFRAGQQALSNRIDAVQALIKQVQQTVTGEQSASFHRSWLPLAATTYATADGHLPSQILQLCRSHAPFQGSSPL